MANREKPKKNAEHQGGRGALPRQAPSMKVIEAGQTEQGEPIEPRRVPPAGKEAAREKQRQEYRYGGIPIGSDPRE